VLGVGFNAYQAAYDEYDTTHGEFSTARSVHSAWFGVLSEMGYPGLVLYLVIVGAAFRACRRVRKQAARGEIAPELGRYAIGLESAMVAFVVGGSFVPFQYGEMLWHFFALTTALQTVAATEAVTVPQPVQVTPEQQQQPAPTFAWGPG
jgi:O-antigen ligase